MVYNLGMADKVLIDFPLDGEKIKQGHYAVRLSAPGAIEVEVSINKTGWQACRLSAGYFWFDFWPEPHEIYQISARARFRGVEWVHADDRYCDVVEE